jgi:hypothetical protein
MGGARSDYSLQPFINAVKTYGMPVEYLRVVESRARRKAAGTDGIDHYSPTFTTLAFTPQTIDGLNVSGAPSDLPTVLEVQTVYHEATHAFLYLTAAENPSLKSFLKAEESRFKGAPLEDGTKGDDTERLLQEAAGEYVGNRAATYWSALWNLTKMQRAFEKGASRNPAFWKAFETIPGAYDRGMALRPGGYQFRGLTNSRQVESRQPITTTLMDYCDRVILESRVPHQFARTRLNGVYNALETLERRR